jgi:hypothetical protein
MHRLKLILLRFVQYAALHVSYAVHRLRRRGRPTDIGWVVGPFEVAHLVRDITAAVPGGYSAVLARHPFYTDAYDWTPSTRGPAAAFRRGWLSGPVKLGELAARSHGFVYLTAEGFLNAAVDQREREFRFLTARRRKIVCYFTGNDIRSPHRMRELEAETSRPNLGTYLAETDAVFASDAYDAVKRRVAEVADRYADAIFNADVDQRGYLTRSAHPFRYFIPDDDIVDDFSRYRDVERPVLVHAPSSPVVKGTQLVRAAITELREDGYDIEYVELVRLPNSEVRAALARAHIVLNEFYASMPGVFGVEAMAAGAVLMTSADPVIEPQLPPESDRAWVVTPHHRVSSHLRRLLDDRAGWEDQARAGNDWVRTHAAASRSAEHLSRILEELG